MEDADVVAAVGVHKDSGLADSAHLPGPEHSKGSTPSQAAKQQ